MADYLNYIETKKLGGTTELLVQMQGGGARVEFVPGAHHKNVVMILRFLADEIERGGSTEWGNLTTHVADLPKACAGNNHYTNDGRGRDFDFCPDCGKPLMKTVRC